VKKRILEYLSVRKLAPSKKAPILLFAGPPGVGKTSLGRSIARALGRKFVRLSLGGVRDEAEIRGHRRTYIGSMPGKILQNMTKVAVRNPLFLLDEVDKMGQDFRGDPSSALLEVLDPEQNHTFNDHYLDLDYDLSKVMFICTANSMHTIPGPLQDRMEVIRIAGYTQDEKMSIARKYLVPKQKEANGLVDVNVKVTNTAVRTIINRYTYESGVRTLERELASVFRKVARDVLKNGKRDIVVDRKQAMKLLGIPKVTPTRKEREDQIGVVTGLSVTSAGGDLLPIEVAFMPGKGKVAVTGQLSEMMKESAHAAVTYVRSRSKRFHIEDKFFENNDLHVHVPTPGPKDGNSAGVTIATAIASAAARIAVRRDVAMTGEVTLRGRVLPIGGLKEKVLAAHRAGIKTVLFPWGNRKDVKEIPRKVRDAITLMPVKHVDEILKVALVLEKPELMFGTPAATSSPLTDVPQSAVS
jgi:ATP-dependent Lon protease